ncbi:MAG: tyrosine-type recombinase/integrase [Gammaproteobacteria bacterium]|nr:tyrosine-type recombinase/integrase [Gammaproteobacteria bacterium]
MIATTPMKRPKRLSATFVNTVNVPGRYGDGRGGHGLSLLVKPASAGGFSKSWAQRIRLDGKAANVGLGAYPVVTLARARQKALANARIVSEGHDPRDRADRAPTFEQAVETVIDIHAENWKDGGKSAAQWRASLRDYAVPKIGRKRVDRISTADVMEVLLPIWATKRETARRVRQRIAAVMKWAVAQGYREDNPAGDAISAALPKNSLRRQHRRALPHAQVAAALERVRASKAHRATALAFEFLVLTACRSGEVRGARWDEVDDVAATWTVPPERMKAGLEHRVPLSGRAVAVLDEAREISDQSGLVFPSPTGRVLSDSTLSKLLRELGIGAVPHGFRSSFRDWAAERTDVAREVCELALAHVNSDRVEAAYRRSDLFERRRDLMQAWSEYVDCT